MERIIRLGALNVVTQPHSAAGYQRLIKKIRGLRKGALIRGDRFGGVASLATTTSPDRAGAFVEGLIATFTQIDANGEWVNLSTGKKAEDADLSTLRIPKNVRPNAAYFRYRFYLKNHAFLFEVGNSGQRLTPGNAASMFTRLFSHPKVVEEFGQVALTVWPTKNSARAIMQNQKIKSIHLVVFAPNPDNQEDASREYLRRLEAMKAQRMERTVVAKKDAFIEPDRELAQEAEVAAVNGRVDAVAKRDGRSVKLSTTNNPFVFVHTYSDEVTHEADAFAQAAEAFFGQLKGR